MTMRTLTMLGMRVVCPFKGCSAIQGEKHSEACRQDYRNKILSYKSGRKR